MKAESALGRGKCVHDGAIHRGLVGTDVSKEVTRIDLHGISLTMALDLPRTLCEQPQRPAFATGGQAPGAEDVG
jgi:hypothetical protein